MTPSKIGLFSVLIGVALVSAAWAQGVKSTDVVGLGKTSGHRRDQIIQRDGPVERPSRQNDERDRLGHRVGARLAQTSAGERIEADVLDIPPGEAQGQRLVDFGALTGF
jgi:hypothetical protein